MREASGLRPLERRFRADEHSGKADGFRAFQQRLPQARDAAVQTLRDQRMLQPSFDFEYTP
jgi:hypothetical protein